MKRRTARVGNSPRSVEFDRSKYGRELLIDAAMVSRMPRFIVDKTPHVLDFFDTLLVTRGRGQILIDGDAYAVKPGTVLFCIPGEVREWRLTQPLDGACLFFAESFITDIFSNRRFLQELEFFATPRTNRSLELSPRQRLQYLEIFATMQRELKRNQLYASHSLRAALYEVLVLLKRWYVAAHGARPRPQTGLVHRFQSLVERHFSRRHRVVQYALELGITPGHLNALCRSQTRQTAGTMIRSRIALEARRLLLYGELNTEQVARRLGFEDPAYFSRFFRREEGSAPTQFRKRRI
jgi:AraC-like DNA-binding protein